VFASDRNGIDDLFQTRADGAGGEQEVIKSGIKPGVRKYPTDWSRHWIAFTAFDATRKQDLWTVDQQGAARPYFQTEFSERDGHLSPDERWMVYTSDETGTDAIYVRPFPNASGGKWRVSGAGGASSPRWRSDGKEIFYVDDRGQMMAVSTASGTSSPEIGEPRMLFRLGGASRAGYAVSNDGSRFLFASAGEGSRVDVPVTVVLNWPTLFFRR
jgi:Tol biopolymer transport system component